MGCGASTRRRTSNGQGAAPSPRASDYTPGAPPENGAPPEPTPEPATPAAPPPAAPPDAPPDSPPAAAPAEVEAQAAAPATSWDDWDDDDDDDADAERPAHAIMPSEMACWRAAGVASIGGGGLAERLNAHLTCGSCSHPIVRFAEYAWDASVDYYWCRNYAPDARMPQARRPAARAPRAHPH